MPIPIIKVRHEGGILFSPFSGKPVETEDGPNESDVLRAAHAGDLGAEPPGDLEPKKIQQSQGQAAGDTKMMTLKFTEAMKALIDALPPEAQSRDS